MSATSAPGLPHLLQPAPPRRGRAARGLASLAAGLALLAGSGCTLLDSAAAGADTRVHTVDPNAPFVVVTVGGVPATTPTLGVAETIPDSTPLPRLEVPTRDPAATPRPAASPSLSRSGATRAARPAEHPAPAGSPAAGAP